MQRTIAATLWPIPVIDALHRVMASPGTPGGRSGEAVTIRNLISLPLIGLDNPVAMPTTIASATNKISGPSSRRVFVFDGQGAPGGGLLAALGAQGYACADVVTDLHGIAERIADVAPDIVLMVEAGHGTKILNAVEAIQDRHPCPVVLFSENGSPERMRLAVSAGVSSYVVVGVGENRVRTAIDMAFVQFAATETLKGERDDARAALAERKLIERAKGIVMAQRGLNEDDAFRFLQKTAMDRNIRLSAIARQVIDAAELLGTGAAVVALNGDKQIFPNPLTVAVSGLQPEPDGQRRSGGSDG